jgi:hypothetical protein
MRNPLSRIAKALAEKFAGMSCGHAGIIAELEERLEYRAHAIERRDRQFEQLRTDTIERRDREIESLALANIELRAENTQLHKDNADLAIRLQRALDARMDTDQAALFAPPAPADEPDEIPSAAPIISDLTAEVVYQLAGIFFLDRKYWTLIRDGERIHAPIKDKEFLEQVHARKVFFADGDAVQIKLRSVTTRDAAGELHAEHEVVKVLRVIPPAQQLPLAEARS